MLDELNPIIAARVEPHEPADQGLSRTVAMRGVDNERAFIPGVVYLLKLKLKVPFCCFRGFLNGKGPV